MLEIKPIQSKEEQAAACAKCKIPYDAECMAYACYVDEEFLGMAQFDMRAEEGYLKNITLLPEQDDFEALFLMGRAVLNFIDLCGIHRAAAADDAAAPRILTAVGFTRGEDGILRADMRNMFGTCDSKKKQ